MEMYFCLVYCKDVVHPYRHRSVGILERERERECVCVCVCVCRRSLSPLLSHWASSSSVCNYLLGFNNSGRSRGIPCVAGVVVVVGWRFMSGAGISVHMSVSVWVG